MEVTFWKSIAAAKFSRSLWPTSLASLRYYRSETGDYRPSRITGAVDDDEEDDEEQRRGREAIEERKIRVGLKECTYV